MFEPRGQLGPDADREKIVLWMQSTCGLFIDIRVCPNIEDNNNPQNLKSFAGIGEYNCALKYFTWNRLLDFRPPGPPDIGLVNFTAPGVIEEDGVLPEDDFKEVWTQQIDAKGLESCRDFVGEVQSKCGGRRGYVMVVGDYFAFTLSRECILSDDRLQSYFEKTVELNDEEIGQVMQHVCVMGKTTDWNVMYSLDTSLVGCCILPDSAGQQCSISALMASLRWSVVQGCPPEALTPLMTNIVSLSAST